MRSAAEEIQYLEADLKAFEQQVALIRIAAKAMNRQLTADEEDYINDGLAQRQQPLDQAQKEQKDRITNAVYEGANKKAVRKQKKGEGFLSSEGELQRVLKLIGEIEREGTDLQRLFNNLGTTSFLDVNKQLNVMEASLQALQEAAEKGIIPAEDLRAAQYNYDRTITGMGAQDAGMQTREQAFNDLGIESFASQRSTRRQRNESLRYIQETPGLSSREKVRAKNARTAQELGYEDELIKSAQAASGYGGFRGREIGNKDLQKLQQEAQLHERILALERQRSAINKNTDTYGAARIQALTAEINNARTARSVIQGSASDVDKVLMASRNAIGVFQDDLTNLIPQLFAFGFAYNFIFGQILPLPGVVLGLAGNFDRLTKSITTYISSTRGIADSSGTLKELVRQSLDLGVNTDTLGKSYLNFAATSKGTILEGRETDMTRTLATAGRNRGFTGEEIGNASKALNQMLSKGNVQSEELRGQLAEAIPGAVQIAARAMGVTTKELYKMVEAGNVASDVFVDKFMGQLVAEGDGVNRVAGTFASVTEQLAATGQVLGASMGNTVLQPITLLLQGVNFLAQALVPLGTLLTATFVLAGATAIKKFLNLSGGMMPLLTGLVSRFVSVTTGVQMMNGKLHATPWMQTKAGATGAAAGLNSFAASAKKVMGVMAKLALITIAFEAIGGAIKAAKGELTSMQGVESTIKGITAQKGQPDQRLNGFQKFLGTFNVGRNIQARMTEQGAASVGDEMEKVNQKLKKSAMEYRNFKVYDEALAKRQQALEIRRTIEGNRMTVQESEKLTKELQKIAETRRNEADKLPLTGAEAGALQTQGTAAIGLLDQEISRRTLLGDNENSPDIVLLKKRRDRIDKEMKALEKLIIDRGLSVAIKLSQFTGAGLQSEINSIQEGSKGLRLFSPELDDLNTRVAGLSGIATDGGLLKEERAAQLQQLQTRAVQERLKVEETAANIRLKALERERTMIQANIDLESTRAKLAETRLQGKVSIAGALGLDGTSADASMDLLRQQEQARARELSGKGKLLDNERERYRLEANIQKIGIEGQTAQLKASRAQLLVEKAIAEAKLVEIKDKDPKSNQVKQYELALTAINGAVGAIDSQITQQGQLTAEVNRTLGLNQKIVDIQKDGIALQQQDNKAASQNEADRMAIEEIQRQAGARKEAADAAIDAEKARVAAIREGMDLEMEATERKLQAQKEISAAKEQELSLQQELVDKQLELVESARKGGFFERSAAKSAIGPEGASDQRVMELGKKRYDLMKKIAQEQANQKRIEITLEQERLKMQNQSFKLKQLEMSLTLATVRVQLSAQAEILRNQLLLKKDKSAEENQVLSGLTGILSDGGYIKPRTAKGDKDGKVAQGQSLITNWNIVTEQQAQLARSAGEYASSSGSVIAAQDAQIASMGEELAIRQELANSSADIWLGELLDSSTSFGRIMSTFAEGLDSLGSEIAGSFMDGLRNGGMSEKISDAAGKFGDSIITQVLEEYIIKPMKDRIFDGIKALLGGGEKPKTEAEQTAASTKDTAAHTQATATGVDTTNGLLDRINSSILSVGEMIKGLYTGQQPAYSKITEQSPMVSAGNRFDSKWESRPWRHSSRPASQGWHIPWLPNHIRRRIQNTPHLWRHQDAQRN